MKKILGVLLLFSLLSGCDREPVYRGLNFVTFNYTPWNLEVVRVRDVQGNGGGAGSTAPGAGEGSISCCGFLRGTEFEVYWTGIDNNEAMKHMFDGRLREFIFKKKTKVYFPPTKIPPGDAPLMFEVHIYPDEHIEFALTRRLLRSTRIPIVSVGDWLLKTYQQQLNPNNDMVQDSKQFRLVARIIGDAWKKYRLEDEQDLRQYVYLAMLVNEKFDELPQFAKVLHDGNRKRGDFARFVQNESSESIEGIKRNPAWRGLVHG